MASLSPRSVHVTDQILAVLREAGEPLPTGEIEKRVGTAPPAAWGQLAYRMLTRLERTGHVEKLKLPDMCSRYWRLAGSDATFPPRPAKAHALRAKPPWRDGPDVTGCGLDPSGCRTMSWAELDAIRDREAATVGWYEQTTCGRCTYLAPPERPSWGRDPVAVVHADAHGTPESGVRAALAAELRALAFLAAEYPGRFRELLESERVLQALGGA